MLRFFRLFAGEREGSFCKEEAEEKGEEWARENLFAIFHPLFREKAEPGTGEQGWKAKRARSKAEIII